jgi:signal transduction histidine kinase
MTLRRRITLLSVGMTALVILAFAIPLAVLAQQVIENDALAKARTTAVNVADYCTSVDSSPSALREYLNRVNARSEAKTAVLAPDGSVVGSHTQELFGDTHGPDSDDHHGEDRPGGPGGYSAREYAYHEGTVIELRASGPAGPAIVRTYLENGDRRAGVWTWWLVIGLVSAALLLTAAVAARALSGRLVRPLADTAETAHRIAAGASESRAPITGPHEVALVSHALNSLADRIDHLLAAEREQVADISHRLRTPLTALRLDVENLPPSAGVEAVVQDIADLERSLTAVIRAARRPQREGISPRGDATRIVAARTSFWTALAEDQGRTIRLLLPEHETLVNAADEDLAAALDALIGNVFAHTPEGTAMTVQLHEPSDDEEPASRTVTLEIIDKGPGIAAGAGRRGRSDRGSTGLGLDIARSCAEASGGSLEIVEREPHGTIIRMRLGLV